MEYAQPAVKVEELRMPGLYGMLPGARVKGRDRKPLEYLLETGEGMLDFFSKAFDKLPLYSGINTFYRVVYDDLKMNRLRGVRFTEQDLKDFILLTSLNYPYNSMIEVEKNKASILGLYTGCLLDLLTERRREQGLETCFYINGQGRKFDYLFSFAKHVDKVIVDNFNARSICSYIANGGGKANLVLVMNCKGDFIASDVGSDKGSNVGMVIMSNVEGQETCFGTGGYGAKAGIVLLVNNKGNDMGGNVATNEGEVELLIAVNNKMNKCLASPGITRGKVGQIVAAYNETNLLCLGGNVNVAENGLIFLDHNNGETLGRVIGANRGYIELAVVANNTGADISEYNGVGHGRLRKLVIHNSGGYTGLNQMREVNINNILTGEQAEKEYHRIRKRYCATKMIDLASSIEEQSSYQEIIRIAEQIKSIHKKVRPKIRKLMKK